MPDKTKTEKQKNKKRVRVVKCFVFYEIQISEDCKITNKLILIEWNRVEFMCSGVLLSVAAAVTLCYLLRINLFEWLKKIILNKKNKNVLTQSNVSKLQLNSVQSYFVQCTAMQSYTHYSNQEQYNQYRQVCSQTIK